MGFNRRLYRGGGGVVAPVTPTTILGSAPAWWVDGSAGTLVDAGGGLASTWGDSSGHSVDFSYAGGQRPSIIAAGLNSRPTVRFATTQYGSANYLSPTPGTQFSYFFFIIKPVSAVANGRILVNGAVSGAVFLPAGTSLGDYCGVTGPLSPNPAGAWGRLEILRSNQATDYCAFNGATSVLASAGNTASSSGVITMNADPGGLNIGNFEWAEGFQWTGASPPTAPQRASLAAYSLAKWGI